MTTQPLSAIRQLGQWNDRGYLRRDVRPGGFAGRFRSRGISLATRTGG
jgi:hypothetical protein